MASVHCHIHYYSSTFFSLVQVYASELVDSISVFLSAAGQNSCCCCSTTEREVMVGKMVQSVRTNCKYLSQIGLCVPSEHTHVCTHAGEIKFDATASIKWTKPPQVAGSQNFLTHTCRPEIVLQKASSPSQARLREENQTTKQSKASPQIPPQNGSGCGVGGVAGGDRSKACAYSGAEVNIGVYFHSRNTGCALIQQLIC